MDTSHNEYVWTFLLNGTKELQIFRRIGSPSQRWLNTETGREE